MVRAATVHNRSGMFQIGFMDMIVPIHESLLKALLQYTELCEAYTIK
jgi:hypothetical protein